MKRWALFLLAAAAPLLAFEPPGQKKSVPVTSAPVPASQPAAAAPVALQIPDDPRPFHDDSTAGGMSVEGTEEPLRSDNSLTIIFPSEMVAPDRIDAEGSASPVVIWPAVDAEFTWSTQSQGYLLVKGPLIPGQTYQFRLREGLKNLKGEALPVEAWGVAVKTPDFAIVEENYGERDSLNSRPQVPLEFNYPVQLADAANHVWFQDRATRQKFPAEIFLNIPDGEVDKADVVPAKEAAGDVTSFRVRPVQPLPLGRFFDLVVDGMTDAYAGRPLLYPRVFPLGPTLPSEVAWVAARNYPLGQPYIEVKFRGGLSERELPPDPLKITPPVPNLKITRDGQFLTAEGDFDTSKRYTVVVNANIEGSSGYGLGKAETWGAAFHPKEAGILFPDRQLRERTALGLRFAFYQINTGALEWKLAAIPLAQLPEALKRETEFSEELTEDGEPVWTKEGLIARQPSEPLVDALGLKVIASGPVPAGEPEKETLREIAWKPADGTPLTGPMLVEVTGKDNQGRVIGNRAIIFFGEAAITRKVTKTETIARIARMDNGRPIAGATVTALDDKLQTLATATTDAEGMVRWPAEAIATCAYLQATSPDASALQPLAMSDQFSSGYLGASMPAPLRGYTLTDRPLYRPGQQVQFKGFVREEKNGLLTVPAGQPLKWTIEKNYGKEVFAEGRTKIDADGGWNGAWAPPADAQIGEYVVRAVVGNQPAGSGGRFQIEEFRNPPFSAICEEVAPKKAGESVIKVESQYFHGAPNAGARVQWKATWVSDSDEGFYDGSEDGEADAMTRIDLSSEHARQPSYSAEVSGEAALNGSGQVVLRSEAPFKDPGNRAHSRVIWKVDVTGPDGQTITGGVTQVVAMADVLLGVKREDAEPGGIQFQWDAKEAFAPAPEKVNLELFHVVTKSVKERLASNVYRYRNFDRFDRVEKRDGVTDKTLKFKPAEPGRYVLLVSPPAGAPGFPVSVETFLEGEGESQVPVQSDNTASVFSVRGRNDDKPWLVGETASLNILSPGRGVAWVSVETDTIKDTFTVPIDGNTSKIDIPVKPQYEPNVFVSVYVLQPGDNDRLAGEMFGYARMKVRAPDRDLQVAVKSDRGEYEPREKISGEVTVTANGRPVSGADLLIYAVDDSILTLGGWQLPSFLDSFFPERSYAVLTYSALRAYVDKINSSWLTTKGFVVGEKGMDEFSNNTFTREEFKPIILWQPSVKTDAQGVAKFACDAPDNLTRFRVVAVGQTKQSQFGAGDTTFEVSKKLLIDPALPRFVRDGDEVELRAVIRQKVADNEKVLVKCAAGGSLELVGEPQQEVAPAQDAPVVVRFKARAKSTGPATVKFDAVAPAQPTLADSVQVTLPVAEPVILRKESVAGTVGNTTFAVREVAPGQWEHTRGQFNFAASSTPWLSKLMGLPYLLEYPHGCFEQKSSRLLAYTLLGRLLEYLPDGAARKANYGNVISEVFKEFEAGLLADGRLPYWPSGVTGNDFVTIQAAWCANEATAAGFKVPEHLAEELATALDNMARGETPVSPTLRAFALFTLSGFELENADEIHAAANALYLERDKLTGEGRAMLGIAFHNFEIEPEKQRQLVSELPSKFDNIGFNPETFSSATRTEALCTWARLLIEPNVDPKPLRERLDVLMQSSSSLSTQENLWLLVAFNALMKAQPAAKLSGLAPKPSAVSANNTAAAWNGQDMERLADFVVKGLKPGGTFVLSAAYRGAERQTPLESRGMKIERVVKNLTDASRDGVKTPFKLGDQILISYRFTSERAQSFVAVEDLLPGGVEVVNPNLALFGEFYDIPQQSGVPAAALSHSEMRDQQTNLYFDDLPSGSTSYSVLARATAAGTFIWPATQIAPMYDSRFFGRSPSGTCAVVSE